MVQIRDTLALVTGGGSGLGAAAAIKLAETGAKVVIFDVNAEGGSLIAQKVRGTFYKVDVSDENDVEAAMQDVVKTLGHPRILVNSAGIAIRTDLIDLQGQNNPLGDFKKVIDINLIGTLNMMKYFAYYIDQVDGHDQDIGVIVNVSSIAGLDGADHRIAYVASKAAVAGITLASARNLSSLGIRVVCIAPGLFETPIVKNADTKLFVEQIPFPPRLGMPEEFADLVTFLCTSNYINGEVIRIDAAQRIGFNRSQLWL